MIVCIFLVPSKCAEWAEWLYLAERYKYCHREFSCGATLTENGSKELEFVAKKWQTNYTERARLSAPHAEVACSKRETKNGQPLNPLISASRHRYYPLDTPIDQLVPTFRKSSTESTTSPWALVGATSKGRSSASSLKERDDENIHRGAARFATHEHKYHCTLA
ncbi:uncharacterized protein FOMMEDRAFT_162702 [Fomitiporia mediterranea MF3/22]|uniref:Uncharacterized protein n=1 Tax=Fomitiporia mediterranea (strain MF3/22) TaxID=694068 RepID=R7SG40_FOMME|nr:uncharacterized protein FOMMEDRAFT_162702 [Fomitiporia mediterranea MF3/22]EJC97678.1 hypothetical protein FOMMEDRAFT_162702 [Fomitiporia mediterranea MF3/22]